MLGLTQLSSLETASQTAILRHVRSLAVVLSIVVAPRHGQRDCGESATSLQELHEPESEVQARDRKVMREHPHVGYARDRDHDGIACESPAAVAFAEARKRRRLVARPRSSARARRGSVFGD